MLSRRGRLGKVENAFVWHDGRHSVFEWNLKLSFSKDKSHCSRNAPNFIISHWQIKFSFPFKKVVKNLLPLQLALLLLTVLRLFQKPKTFPPPHSTAFDTVPEISCQQVQKSHLHDIPRKKKKKGKPERNGKQRALFRVPPEISPERVSASPWKITTSPTRQPRISLISSKVKSNF